jgi:hypothetical protein
MKFGHWTIRWVWPLSVYARWFKWGVEFEVEWMWVKPGRREWPPHWDWPIVTAWELGPVVVSRNNAAADA